MFKIKTWYAVPFILYFLLFALPWFDSVLLSEVENQIIAYNGVGRLLPDYIFTIIDFGILLALILLMIDWILAKRFYLLVHGAYFTTLLVSGVSVSTELEVFFGSLYLMSVGWVCSSFTRSGKADES